MYEGWGVTQGTPLSTGRFSDLAAPDTAAPYSGPSAGPPFPGEDFVRNLPVGVTPPVNFADGASVIVISVEPDLGGVDPTGAGPFSVKPLVGAVPAGLADHTLTALGPNLVSVPSGTATVSGPLAVAVLPNTGSGGLASSSGAEGRGWIIAAAGALAMLVLGLMIRRRA